MNTPTNTNIVFKKQVDKFTAPIFRKLLIPALISSVGWALSDMADAIVVGQKFGTVGLASIGLILPIYMINFFIVYGLGIGGSTNFSILISKGKIKEAKKNWSSVLYLGLILSIVIALFGNIFIDPLLKILGTTKNDGDLFIKTKDYLKVLLTATPLFYLSTLLNYYLRNDENEKFACIGSIVGYVVDIAFNVLLVIFFELGTFGAALSTAIGNVVSILIYIIGLVIKKNSNLKFTKLTVKDINIAFHCLTRGFAISVNYLYLMIFFIISNNILVNNPGENGVATFDLIQNTSYLFVYLYEGIARAMQPIVSTYYSEHNELGKKNIYKIGLSTGIILGFFLILLILIYPQIICIVFGIFGTSSQSFSESALRLYAISAFFAGINVLNSNYYQSCEQEKTSFFIETLRGFVILLPVTFIFSIFKDRTFFWLLFPTKEIITFVIFKIFKHKFKKSEFYENRILQKTIHSNIEDISNFIDEADKFCEKHGGNIKQKNIIRMAIEDISMSIVKHGLKDINDGYLQITIVSSEDGLFEIHLRDNAISFNPFELKRDKKLNIESDFNAVGVDFIKKKAKSFFYRRYHGFNSMVIEL